MQQRETITDKLKKNWVLITSSIVFIVALILIIVKSLDIVIAATACLTFYSFIEKVDERIKKKTKSKNNE